MLGLTFTPVPKPDVPNLEKDIYEFTRKLRLTYHFRNDNHVDESIIKRKSIYCPKRGENEELEKICHSLEISGIYVKRTKDNMRNLRNALSTLTDKVRKNEIVIKPADKGAITLIMSPTFYWNMCQKHLNNNEYYEEVDSDPSGIVYERIRTFTEKHKEMLTQKEYDYLVNENYKISNFYMLPKLHKSAEINTIIQEEQTEYIRVDKNVNDIEGRPINSGPCYHTRGLSLIIHAILLPCLHLITRILKDTFDFQNKVESSYGRDIQLVTWDIKSLYTNIKHELFYTAIEYWLEKLGTQIPLLHRFSKEFVIEGLSIILEYNYFQINAKFFHQMKGTAMGTPAAVVGSNLVVGYLEEKMFRLLPQKYPNDFVDFLTRNYFRFIDDIFHEWLAEFDIKGLYELINNLDPNLKFEMEEISSIANFLDISISIKDNEMKFDIYYKPTNSFNYLKYTSCHPKHTKKNISLSLGRRIIRIVSENRQNRLEGLKTHLMACGHPIKVIEDSFSKIYQPTKRPKITEPIIFNQTYNPNQEVNLHKIRNCLQNVKHTNMVKAFENRKPLCTTRQPKNLKQLLVKAKFNINPIPRSPNRVGLFPCGNCKYCKNGYIRYASEFTLYHRNKPITWTYNRLFTCESINILYVAICRYCKENYVGKTKNCKKRIAKHASDVRIPANSNCKKCSEHLRRCSSLQEPYFHIYPFYYVDDPSLRHFMEKRFILRWKPSLNSN